MLKRDRDHRHHRPPTPSNPPLTANTPCSCPKAAKRNFRAVAQVPTEESCSALIRLQRSGTGRTREVVPRSSSDMIIVSNDTRKETGAVVRAQIEASLWLAPRWLPAGLLGASPVTQLQCAGLRSHSSGPDNGMKANTHSIAPTDAFLRFSTKHLVTTTQKQELEKTSV
uniref:Uncharacterized protein n=1 Tax=Knipowitschia caucasica TaxID=637954 RepID=A0AAV2MQI6_KNICA